VADMDPIPDPRIRVDPSTRDHRSDDTLTPHTESLLINVLKKSDRLLDLLIKIAEKQEKT